MLTQPYFTIEAHSRSATLYLHRSISEAGVLDAVRRCDALPETVWFLRVELSAAEPLDAGTYAVLTHALNRWREARSGMTHIALECRDAAGPGRPRLSWSSSKRMPNLFLRDRVVAAS